MPIDIERFDSSSAEDLEEPSNPETVLLFLIENDDKAFTAAEIAEETGIDRNSIGTVLSRLEDRGLVRHKGEYWALGDPERIRSFGTYQRATRRLNDRFGEEDPESWREHAPDEPHPNVDG
ncbi:MarR family transcriptional regulator [Natronomonas salina]|uniref:MarR family transcriptional regulator n=1 Tax=Natronomonas salina TaxID=1710540 RepID=UPI0015B727C5|nr:helix-turn-helix domain-containing protein [Natronomonas salina]QLD88732.1 MarR family transcriptional regulator [Natronomonas salina]